MIYMRSNSNSLWLCRKVKAIKAVILTSFVFLGFYDLAFAEATCSSVVSYTVERDAQSASEVYFGELKAKGLDEAATKLKLEAEVLKAKAKALERCKLQYENTAGCLQAKLSSAAGVFQSASFSARKALEEALLADCKKQQGSCKEVKASEIKCSVLEPTPAAEEKGAADKKKDDKAKK